MRWWLALTPPKRASNRSRQSSNVRTPLSVLELKALKMDSGLLAGPSGLPGSYE
jgi:hypothetical protein